MVGTIDVIAYVKINIAIETHYTDTDARTAVIGQIYAAIDTASLVLQLATGPILRLLGVPLVLLLIPSLLGAAVAGYALGGGCELAVATDLRIASENSRMGIPVGKLGISIGHREMRGLVNLVGKGNALYILLSARLLDAQESLRIGLVNQVVELRPPVIDHRAGHGFNDVVGDRRGAGSSQVLGSKSLHRCLLPICLPSSDVGNMV